MEEENWIENGAAESDFSGESDEENCSDPPELTTCLFCASTSTSVDIAIKHLLIDHKIDLSKLKSKFNMDQYSFLKLINCIRSEKRTVESILTADVPFWADEKYLKPIEYETWLCYDYDEIPDGEQQSLTQDYDAVDQNTKEVSLLRQKVQQQEILLSQAYDDMAKMRASFQRLIEKDEIAPKPTSLNCVGATSLEVDESYFTGYAHFGIHHEMLSDVVRTSKYQEALLKNKDFMIGKEVLDVGCGTSILSIFASKAGAKTVVGIDNSDIIYNAMDIIKNNNIQNVVLIKGRLEDTELPQKKYDIIISEWMGYFLLFEGMLDSVLYARDHHLKAGGILMPNRCSMSIAGCGVVVGGSDELYKKHVSFWNNVYGLDMSNLREQALQEPLIDVVDAKYILTEANICANIDLNTADLNYSNFTYAFNLSCKKDGHLSAFVGYFDTYFDLPNPVFFSTSPSDIQTHWKQVIFFINEPQKICAGQIVKGQIFCRRGRKNARSLEIKIEAFGNKFTYYLD